MRGDSDSAGPLAGSQRHRALAHAAARDLSVLVNCLFYCDALNVKLVFLPNFESLIDETADPSADRQLLIRRHPRRCPVPFGSVRDLGRVLAACSSSSGLPASRPSGWFPAWLPAVSTPRAATCKVSPLR